MYKRVASIPPADTFVSPSAYPFKSCSVYAPGAMRAVLKGVRVDLEADLATIRIRKTGVTIIDKKRNEYFIQFLDPQVAFKRYVDWRKETRAIIREQQQTLRYSAKLGDWPLEKWFCDK